MTDYNWRSAVLACDRLERGPERAHALVEVSAGVFFTPLVQVHSKAGLGEPPYDAHLRHEIEYVWPLDRGRHNQHRTRFSGQFTVAAQPDIRLLQHRAP